MANPANTTPTTTDTEWDPLEFWIKHKQKVVLFTALLIAALVIYGIYQFTQEQTRAAAAKAFATAKTAEDYRKVITEYPNTSPAANASLLLADQLRNENKLDESSQLLRTFIDQNSNHPLISGAYTSLAANLETAGKTEEALSTYAKVTSSYPTSFSAPIAHLGQARIFKAQGKIEEAKRAYETVITQFSNTVFAQEATRQSSQLKK